MIPVEFAAVNDSGVYLGSQTLSCLIDSGSDITLLPLSILSDLGLTLADLTPGRPGIGPFDAPTDPGEPTWERTLLARLCGRWTSVRVGFAAKVSMPLLGRDGAFDALNIAFIRNQGLFFARP